MPMEEGSAVLARVVNRPGAPVMRAVGIDDNDLLRIREVIRWAQKGGYYHSAEWWPHDMLNTLEKLLDDSDRVYSGAEDNDE